MQVPDSSPGLMTAKAASTICLLAGIWFFVSPLVYRGATSANAWNNWIVGGFMILFSAFRVARPAYSTNLAWVNLALGVWAFFSPWIYGYTGELGKFINSMCVGVVVLVLSIILARVAARSAAIPHT
jgi:ABC-type glycerol-3-phosphate transport system permease component